MQSSCAKAFELFIVLAPQNFDCSNSIRIGSFCKPERVGVISTLARHLLEAGFDFIALVALQL